ncbi:hypothetical protein ACHAXH_004508 [Discostella pseudostelligera]
MASAMQFVDRRDGMKEGTAIVVKTKSAASTTTRPPRLRALTASSTTTSSTSSSLPLSFTSSALSSSSSAWLSSSNRVRCKFLHKIGIIEPISSANSSHRVPLNSIASVTERSARDLRDVPRFNAPLKYANDVEEKRKMKRQEKQLSSKSKKSVDFDSSVTVVPIPMRSEYSDRIKTQLWWGRLEFGETVDRNMAEFASEDYNWRNACPEEEMYYCTETNELVHPVHIELGRYVFGSGGRVNKINGQYCC